MATELSESLSETLDVFGRSVDSHAPLTTSEVADALDLSRRSAYDRLDRLVDRGAIETKKVGARARVWWRPDPTDGASGASDGATEPSDDGGDAGSHTPDADAGSSSRESESEDPGSEDRLRVGQTFAEHLLDAHRDIVYTFDAEGRLVTWNDRLPEVTGYTDDELGAMTPLEFITEEYVPSARRAIDRVLNEGEPIRVEFPLVTADGETIPHEFSGAPVTDDDGTVTGFTGVGRDVSDRAERERRLRAERDLFERLIEAVRASVLLFDDDGSIVRANERALERLDVVDVDEYEYADVDVYDADGELIPPARRPYARVLETGEPVADYHCRIDLPERGERWVSINAVPLHDDEGAVDRVIVTSQDVTRLKEQAARLERQRDELEDELRAVFGRVDEAFFALDEDWQFTHVNERAEAVLERSAGELVGRNVWEEFPWAEGTTFQTEYERAMADQEPVSFEAYYDPLDAWLEVTAYPSESGLSVYFRDVTERKERERELERYETLFTESRDVNAVLNPDGTFRYLPPSTEHVLGYEPAELRGETTFEYVHPDDRERVMAEFARLAENPDYEPTVEFRYEHADGSWIVLEARGRNLLENPTIGGIVAYTRDVTERRERERALEQQREQLVALDNLNQVARDITETILEKSSREAIERTVCERLAASGSYQFACIYEPDLRSGTIEQRVEAGVDGYVDRVALSEEAADPSAESPGWNAVRSLEPEFRQNVRDDASFGPWQQVADEYGYESLAAIPIVHEDVTYGVLGIYSERPDAFADQEREVVAQLGGTIGSAIAAVERKQALLSDEVVEVEFKVAGLDQPAGISGVDGTISFENFVASGGGTYLAYGTVPEDAVESLRAICEALDHWESVTLYGETGGEAGFELALAEPPIVSAVASHGGEVTSAVLSGTDLDVTVQLPPSVDVRTIATVVEEAYPAADILMRRQTTTVDDTNRAVSRALTDDLTERQRAALEASYYAGFFEWPRENSGDEVAESLGVSPPTFHEHLRAAQKKLLDAMLS